jgi:hypothetical protein
VSLFEDICLRPRVAIATAGIVAAGLSAGCGVTRARPGVSRAQFIAAADGVCRHEQAKLLFIAERARRFGHLVTASHVIRQQVAQFNLATGRLESLPEPPADVAAINRWLTARTVAATVALDLAEAPAKGDAQAVADVRRELATTRARAHSLASSYGSQVCGETD